MVLCMVSCGIGPKYRASKERGLVSDINKSSDEAST